MERERIEGFGGERGRKVGENLSPRQEKKKRIPPELVSIGVEKEKNPSRTSTACLDETEVNDAAASDCTGEACCTCRT